MPYTPIEFQNLPSKATPISAAALGHMQSQYPQAVADARIQSAADIAAALEGVVPTTRGLIPEGADLNTYQRGVQVGSYRLRNTSTTPVLNAPDTTDAIFSLWRGDNLWISAIQTVVSESGYWYRKATGEGSWADWVSLAPSTEPELTTLAKQDGWLALYDPSNPDTLELGADGRVVRLHDSLGNLPPLAAYSGGVTELQRGAFGGADGISGVMLASIPGDLLQPASIMMIARDTGKTGAARNLLGGGSLSKRFEMRLGAAGNAIIGGVGQTRTGNVDNYISGDHVWEAYYENTNSTLTIDGALAHRGLPSAFTAGASQLVAGALYVSTTSEAINPWGGTWGAIAVRSGNNDANRNELNRMRKALMSRAGVEQGAPWLWPEIRALSLDANGIERVVVGDPDQVFDGGIASITKLINALVVRETVTDSMLDDPVGVIAADEFLIENAPRLVRGDIATYRVLLQSMLIPSNNVAPRTLARVVGDTYPGAGTGQEKFVARMNERLHDWGYDWSWVSSNPGGGGRMSMRQIAQLLVRAMQDPVIAGMLGTKRTMVQITGPDARSVEIVNTFITRQVYGEIPEWVASKDGTGTKDAGSVFAWNHPDGTVHVSVMQSQRLGAPGRSASFINNSIIEADKNGTFYDKATPAAAFVVSGKPVVDPPSGW